MADMALEIAQGGLFADIVIDAPFLAQDDDLQTAVILSLFSNRLAQKEEVKEDTDRQGWWGDTFIPVAGSLLGSKLWLLRRSKLTQEVANLAREYCLEALQWLIEDQISNNIVVQTEIRDLYTLRIFVDIYRPSNVANFQFDYVWKQF